MARTLKTYRTSIGFFDLAVAAPSMKAALAAWGAGKNLFHQGFAKETDDPAIVAATMAKPGVVLRRAVGSHGAFREDAALPKTVPAAKPRAQPKQKPKQKQKPKKVKAKAVRKIDEKAARAAAVSFEREQRRRESARLRQERAEERAQALRQRAIAGAQAALEKARASHDSRSRAIEDERAALDRRAKAEDARWAKQRAQLESALRRART